MSQQKIYLTDKQVSEIAGQGVQTLCNDRHKGQGFPYIKLGRLVRYDPTTIEEILRSRLIETKPL